MSTERQSLVEPEGTNAGSADSTDEDASAPGVDVRGGGEPEESPDLGDPAVEAADETEMVGAPAERAGEPGQEHGSSGQDAGSMDPA